jgi:hypothetical protein
MLPCCGHLLRCRTTAKVLTSSQAAASHALDPVPMHQSRTPLHRKLFCCCMLIVSSTLQPAMNSQARSAVGSVCSVRPMKQPQHLCPVIAVSSYRQGTVFCRCARSLCAASECPMCSCQLLPHRKQHLQYITKSVALFDHCSWRPMAAAQQTVFMQKSATAIVDY